MNYDSQFALGAEVDCLGHAGVIVGVRFITGKVMYDINLDVGGETLRDIDSTFVEA